MCVCGERGEGGIHSIRLGYIIIIIFNPQVSQLNIKGRLTR